MVKVILVGPGAEKDRRAAVQKKIQALSFCMEATRFAHGAVVGDPSFAHTSVVSLCACGYGESIRIVKGIRKELYAQVSESRKARKAAKR
jgi:hypothetical protein